jgi:hypothetical protein
MTILATSLATVHANAKHFTIFCSRCALSISLPLSQPLHLTGTNQHRRRALHNCGARICDAWDPCSHTYATSVTVPITLESIPFSSDLNTTQNNTSPACSPSNPNACSFSNALAFLVLFAASSSSSAAFTSAQSPCCQPAGWSSSRSRSCRVRVVLVKSCW